MTEEGKKIASGFHRLAKLPEFVSWLLFFFACAFSHFFRVYSIQYRNVLNKCD